MEVAKEALPRPLNGKKAIGAATPTLIPTFPTSHSYRNLRALAPLDVNRHAMLPYSPEFTSVIASSIVSA